VADETVTSSPLAPAPPSSPVESDRIARAAGAAGAATLMSRVLGLVREQVLAALFGAGNDMDAYLVAFRIPNLVRDLFAEGAMSAALVPTFTRHLTLYGTRDAWRLANSVLNALLLVTGTAVIAGIVYARPLVGVYASHFADVPGKIELTIRLARVMLPFLPMVALAAAVMGMLNSLRHYFVPALAPATFNVVAIGCAVLLTPVMPAVGLPRVMSLAIGVLAGGATQLAIQWPLLRREGFRYRPALDASDPGLRRILVLMGPGTVGLAATQVNLFVSTLIATSQGTGAVSWLQYAFRVMYLPLGLFGVSVATAILPATARHLAVQNTAAVARTLTRGLALMLAVNVPASFGLVTLADPIIRLLLERGHFTASDTVATAAALRLYAVGLVGYSTTRIASPVFYALGRSRIPVALSAASVCVNLVLSVLFVRAMGFLGLALATSIAALIHGALCIILLRRQLGGIGMRRLAATLAGTAVAAAAMSAVVVTADRALYDIASAGGAGRQAAALGVSIAAGVAALVISARLLGIPEFQEMLHELRARVRMLLDGPL
jgi:putative peptidoglycan lipid II flippase